MNDHPARYRHWVHKTIWLAAWVATSVMRTEIAGTRPQAPCIIVSNHLHFLDIPLSGRYAVSYGERAHWLAKIELFRVPLLRFVLRSMQAVPIDREHPDRASIERIVAFARDDKVVIFPEGHRSEDGHLQQGKEGVAVIARRAGVPVIPVAVSGTEGGLLPLLLRRQVLRITMGEPVQLEHSMDRKGALAAIMNGIDRLLPPEHRMHAVTAPRSV